MLKLLGEIKCMGEDPENDTMLVKMCYELTNVSYYLYYYKQKQRKIITQLYLFLFPGTQTSNLSHLSFLSWSHWPYT